VLTALATLLLPLALGIASGRHGWLASPRLASEQAMAALNRFALLVAFPSLVVATFLDPARLEPASAPRWPVLVLASAPLLVGVAVSSAIGGRTIGGETLPSRGTLALVALFGNSAYLGLPLVAAVLGPEALPTASVIVSVHVALTVTLGTAMLEPTSAEGATRSRDLGRLARTLITSPLAMSPIVGVALATVLAAVGLSEHPTALALFRALELLGKTASPLGIFVLGLFLGMRPPTLTGPRGQLAFVLVRLVVVPLATILLALALRAVVPIDREALRTLVLLASVPAAISTFAMAEQAGADAEAVARAIVTTSVLSLATLPACLAVTELLFPS
jgi:malonate transporter